APNILVVTFDSSYNTAKSYCERPDRRRMLEQAVSSVARRPFALEFQLRAREGTTDPKREAKPAFSARELQKEVFSHPWVQQVCEIFSMEVAEVIPPPRQRGEVP